jgi:hypothetical protein
MGFVEINLLLMVQYLGKGYFLLLKHHELLIEILASVSAEIFA